MAEHMLNDQQQEQQPQQLPRYGVDFGIRQNLRALPYPPKAIARVPEYIGVSNIRAKPLPAPPVREQQQEVMLQEGDMLVNQPLIQQHNLQQHNIAYTVDLTEYTF